MKRGTAYCVVLVALACAVVPPAPGQNDAKPASESKKSPASVYLTVTNLTATSLPARSAEYEREGWSLVSSYVDSTNANALTGIFRRKYMVLKADEEPLKGLQKTTWNCAELFEYGRERDMKRHSLVLRFEDNKFTFIQADPSNKLLAVVGTRIMGMLASPDGTGPLFAVSALYPGIASEHLYTQAGTIQYAQPVRCGDLTRTVYAMDLLVDTDTRDREITHPYTTIRTLISYDDDRLRLVSNGSSGDRPEPSALTARTPISAIKSGYVRQSK